MSAHRLSNVASAGQVSDSTPKIVPKASASVSFLDLSSAPAPDASSAPVSAPSSVPVSASSSAPVSASSSAPVSASSSAPVSASSSAPVSASSSAPVSASSSAPVSASSSAPVSASSAPVSASSSATVSAPSSVPVSAPSSAPVSAPSSAPVSALSSAADCQQQPRQHEPMSLETAARLSIPELSLRLPDSWDPDVPFPEFTRPRRVGRLSVPGAGLAHARLDASQLKRLRLPRDWSGLNLSDWLPGGPADWESALQPPWQRDIDDLLAWLRLARPNLAGRIVCCRGLLTRLTCQQLERQQDLCVAAIRVHGDGLLLCQFTGAEAQRLEAQRNRRDRLMAAWGPAFEALATGESGGGRDGDGGRYCEIVEARLGNLRLMCLGEVDCCDGDELLELKLTSQHGAWRRRLPRWWAQSFLLGVPSIFAGFRDAAGRLRDVARLPVDRLLAMSRGHLRPDEWSAGAGLDWAHRFLSHAVRVCATADEAGAVFVLYWKPGQDRVLVSRHGPASPFYFLPHWLLRDLSQHQLAEEERKRQGKKQ
ncbi:hypothetical protein BOX15_Mlig029165g1 [Macrostomum lignano]|uniref:Decapping nuclease n=1 Tax=Macrostomum lignano TaxID=282301 RepID=A0A267EM17_9PLAT|nr:hypothetical protein BOX15_Mlig029165g1 [Macrostomum lignano]